MEVKLINITPKPIETIFKSYRLCYSSLPYKHIREREEDSMCDFIKPLMAEGHTSPLEHVNVTFEINGISRACLAQLTRHRTMSFNVKSQRYVNEESFDYVIPEKLLKDKETLKMYAKHMEDVNEFYKILQSKGYKNEDCRSVLPNATTTNLVVTVDANNFRKFLALRLCVHAQDEIRNLATEMCKQAKTLIPFIDYKVMNCNRICNKCYQKEVRI